MIYLGDKPVGITVKGVKLLHTMTFVNALGVDGRQTVSPDSSWDDYDMLLFVPDLEIASQEGQTNGNWLWMGIYRRGATSSGNNSTQYNSVGTVGKRDIYFTATITKGWSADRYYWRYGFTADRGGNLMLIDNQDINSEHFSDLDITYGGYYGSTYGVLNGTCKIYGVKLS